MPQPRVGPLVICVSNLSACAQDHEGYHKPFINGHDYPYDSVVPIITTEMLRRSDAELGVIVDVFVDKAGGLQFLGCMDWDATLGPHRTVRLIGVNDVHLSLLNPHVAEWSWRMLGPRPFFVLSHFLYLGTQPPPCMCSCAPWP